RQRRGQRDLWRHNKSCARNRCPRPPRERGGAGFPWVRAQLSVRQFTLRVRVPCPVHLRGRSPTPALDPLAPVNPLIRGPRTPGLRRWIQSLALLLPNCSSSRIPTVPRPHSGLWVQSDFPLGFLSRTEPRLTRSCRGAFRSPRPLPKSGQADGTSEESLHLDIQKLKEKRHMLDKETSQLVSEGYSVDELEDYITQLHEYNDIKDVGQMLMGKLAVIRGVTTKELYPEFGLDMND
uniref:DNA repair protein SWI5 homolog n=1 Tax=Pan paniscus TaxID=9597 RepID=A0A2R9ASE6_PANPA